MPFGRTIDRNRSLLQRTIGRFNVPNEISIVNGDATRSENERQTRKWLMPKQHEKRRDEDIPLPLESQNGRRRPIAPVDRILTKIKEIKE